MLRTPLTPTDDEALLALMPDAACVIDASGRVLWGSASVRDLGHERRRTEAVGELRFLEGEAEQIAGLGSWRLELDDGSLAWSPEMYRIFGVDPSVELDLDEVIATAVYPDDRAMLDEINAAVLRDGVPHPAQYRIQLPDGSVKWVNAQGRQVKDDSGRVVALVGFVQDITDRRAAEEALLASEARYRSIIDGMQDAYLRADMDGHLTLANQAAARMYGFASPSEMVGIDARSFYADERERDGVIEQLRRDGTVIDRIGRGVHRDGSTFWVSLNVGLAWDENGAAIGTEGFARDVTDRILAQEALAASETKFRTIADFTYDWETWTAPDGAVLYVSPSCERCTGYTVEEFTKDAELFERLVHPDDRVLVGGHFGTSGTAADCPITFRIVRRDGQVRWIEHVCEAVCDENGADLGRRASNRDVTDRILAEKAQTESFSLMRATLESTADGILVVGRDGRVAGYNQQYADLWGIPRRLLEAADDSALLDFIAGLIIDSRSFLAGVEYLYEHPEEESFDLLEFKDGRVFERYSRPQTIDERIVGRVWSFRDITQRAAAERALRESEEDLRDAQAIARIGSYVYDLTEDVWTSSETMNDIFGIDASYVRNLETWTALVHEEDREMMSRYFAEEVVGKRLPFDKEYRVVRNCGGDTIWVHGHGRLEEDAEGNPTALIGAIQDITARHRGEKALRETNQSLERMVYDVAEAMGRVIEIRDPYTKGHQERTSRLAKAIATEMALAPHDVSAVEMAAVVHDIGKLSVPAEILSRPARLSELEMSLVREHPQHGYDILKDIPFPWPVAQIVLQHHERIDGSGYPSGLTDGSIIPLARVLAVADVVEAMATHRPYRPALGLDAALAELSECAEKYDAVVVAACLRLAERGEIDL